MSDAAASFSGLRRQLAELLAAYLPGRVLDVEFRSEQADPAHDAPDAPDGPDGSGGSASPAGMPVTLRWLRCRGRARVDYQGVIHEYRFVVLVGVDGGVTYRHRVERLEL